MRAPVNKIIPLSVVDGPGNRTSVFLQKCNIACAYCHNPETQRMCTGCGICVEKCPVQALSLVQEKGRDLEGLPVIWDEKKCVQCDTCIRVCPYFSSPKIHLMEVEEVFSEIKKNLPFIRGITVSGGECTLYPEFLTELFTQVRAEGLTCYIDSNGCVDFSRYPDLMDVCDKVMLDVKAWDENVFYSLTRSSNETVKKNLIYLAKRHQLEEVRIVCLEPEVDVEAVIRGIAGSVREHLDDFTLKLIAFRSHGVRTALKDKEMPSGEQMEKWRGIAVNCGFSNIRIV
ncbi:YjjW family glycine radical enzyme activase [Faecalicatena orotica]|uniref:YjjW family glycine radical enzyme activase n=1 Tax=Faecalicatena orotica TaxID=1544 RepID=A0A2Y9C5F2_9FIRM|nr:YjjW family glycine radical enzyme activase [Faecalicatena orotica]PWJ29030.1 YjjW family glycine radical enzyme activase [Faecalicatena orotica]SSA56200.1 glycine radical enzyme activase, YjjW family [Faecalicatena orotica]